MTSYTLLIPASQLFILNRWFPHLKLQAFEGLGSEQAEALKTEFDYGFKQSKQTNNVSLKYKMEYGERTFQDIIDGIDGHVPDISFNSFCYMENNLKLGPDQPTSVLCKWNRESIQKTKLKALVMDGDYPNRDIAIAISGIQEALDSLPRNVKKRFRTSFMTLETTPNIHDCEYSIKAIRHPRMLFIKDRVKNWLLGDKEYKPRG